MIIPGKRRWHFIRSEHS